MEELLVKNVFVNLHWFTEVTVAHAEVLLREGVSMCSLHIKYLISLPDPKVVW